MTLEKCLISFEFTEDIAQRFHIIKKKEGQLARTNSDLSESLEDYLETILELETKNKVARTKDIAEKMGVQRGTVTGALKSLAEKGLINYEPYSFITLKKKGLKIAKEVSHRHMVLRDFLFRVLQIDKHKADETACRMEHAMDKATFERLVKFIDFIDKCPRSGEDWIRSFVNYCSTDNHNWKNCDACIDKCRSYHQTLTSRSISD